MVKGKWLSLHLLSHWWNKGKQNNSFFHCSPVPVSLSWIAAPNSGCGLLTKVCAQSTGSSYDPKWKGRPFLYSVIWKKGISWDRESHFFWQANVLTDPLWKMEKPSIPPKIYKSNWTIWAHWGVEGTAKTCWHNSSGLDSSLGRVYFLVSCSLIRILCNTWDSPRTLINCLFSVES